jgi:hypothetical protein
MENRQLYRSAYLRARAGWLRRLGDGVSAQALEHMPHIGRAAGLIPAQIDGGHEMSLSWHRAVVSLASAGHELSVNTPLFCSSVQG